MRFKHILAAGAALCGILGGGAHAAELEVTHWWTSAGESSAVAEFARAFDATGNNWKDAAIAGGGGAALQIIVSRIVGGNPMAATQLIHGRQAEELVQAGLMRDLTEVAERDGWKQVIQPPTLLDSCTYEGKIYCVPTNIHSQQWLWLSDKTFADAGIPTPKDWNEFVAAAPALEAAGKIPLVLGREPTQALMLMNALLASVGGPDLYRAVYADKNVELAAGPDMAKVFAALADARRLSANSKVQQWNEATRLVIVGEAGGQIIGDWVQGEFQLAGLTAGKDYECLPGLGLHEIVSTGGNAFYFPVLNDPERSAAQLELASAMLSPAAQLAFNAKKGSLPVRGDVDVTQANACMRKGLDLLSQGKSIPAVEQLITPDTQAQLVDLASRFLADANLSPEQAQEQFAQIISEAN